MSYSISFTKPYGADYTDPQYQDRITGDIWFTRLNEGGPLFNYKYYLDYGYVNPVVDQVGADFWYEGAPNLGGTTGVKWGILNKTGFPNQSAPGINPDLFAVPGYPANFFSFSQMCVLLRAMIDESSKPVSLVNSTGSNEWLLANDDTVGGTNMPYLVSKDLCCYIPATNQYFKIRISVWGAGGSPSITYVRTPLFYARVPFYTQVLHQNENYTDYKVTYYTDNSSVVQVYQKNGTTNCYQYVGAIAVASCQSPVPYVPPTPPGPPGPPIPPPVAPQVVSFTTTGSTTWTAPLTLSSSVEYLVVGGGGGGGGSFDTGAGGGGGAGLVLTGTVSVTPGATYNIVVGAGGIAGIGNRTGSPPETSGGTGGTSSFDSVVAVGGNGGYASRTTPIGDGVGGTIANAGTLTAGGGGNGSGNASSAASAGGGGGNGSVGGTSVNNTPGVGGSGISSSISGTSVTYGAGGSGGQENSNTNGANGSANTGNGAVGASSTSFDSSNGGAGGSGIVILKFTA